MSDFADAVLDRSCPHHHGESATASLPLPTSLHADVVEGVCVQTVTVLRAALEHAVRPVLVLNKIDRLFAELHLGPMEAYLHIVDILAQVNVIMGVREVEEMMAAASVADEEPDEMSEWKLEDNIAGAKERNVSGFFHQSLATLFLLLRWMAGPFALSILLVSFRRSSAFLRQF